MTKKVLRILGLVMLFIMSVTAVALADVPDPYGRPQRRPMPVLADRYWISREGHYHNYGENKVAIELEYIAPQQTEINYKLLDKQENIVLEGTEQCEANRGKIMLVLPKPQAGETNEYSFESSCSKNVISTAFGIKKLDKPAFKGYWNCTYIVSASSTGEINIRRLNAVGS